MFWSDIEQSSFMQGVEGSLVRIENHDVNEADLALLFQLQMTNFAFALGHTLYFPCLLPDDR